MFSVVLFFLSFIIIHGHELCTDTTAPQRIDLAFCSAHSGNACCTPERDTEIQNIFSNLGQISEECSSLVHPLLCAECDSFSAHLLGVEINQPRDVPFMCPDYCTRFYEACKDETFNWGDTPLFEGAVISQTYPTVEQFCAEYEPTVAPDYCFNGTKFEPVPPPDMRFANATRICVEYISENQFIDEEMIIALVEPPDHSQRLFAAYKKGVIGIMSRDGELLGSYLDISEKVHNAGEEGFLGLVFHPNYSSNGLFYTYYSTKEEQVECLNEDDCCGQPCTNGVCEGDHTVILSEFTVSEGDQNVADELSERILLKVNEPFANHQAGALLFSQGYLYVHIGDGGGSNDPFNNSQNLQSKCGKILRIDVDGRDPDKEYAVPEDNPFPDGKYPEIWAYGFRNIWRCSFDRENPMYHFCGDVGEAHAEEIDLVVKGGNYGWRKYEGPFENAVYPDDPEIPNRIDPILVYTRDNPRLGSGPAVIGGYMYRGITDPCFYANYIYADFEGPFWSAQETVPGSGFFVESPLELSCAEGDTQCQPPTHIFSFAEDQLGDVYILGAQGILRITDPHRCPEVSCAPEFKEEPESHENGTVILYPFADAYVRGGQYSPQNNGNSSLLLVKQSDNKDFERETFIEFDLSQVHGIHNVSTCSLFLYSPDGPSDILLGISLVNTSWDEQSITFDDVPSSYEINQFNLSADSNVVRVDVTDVCTVGLEAHSSSLGFRIFAKSNDNRIVYFASRESGPEKSPKLIIEYSGEIFIPPDLTDETDRTTTQSTRANPQPQDSPSFPLLHNSFLIVLLTMLVCIL